MKMKHVAVAAAIPLALGIASPAEAHTGAFSADCNGVVINANSYDGTDNRWTVTIGGDTRTGTFGSSFSQTFPVPQEGATTSWSAAVEAADGSFHFEDSGTVGPCGELPAEPPTTSPERKKAVIRLGKVEKCDPARSKVFVRRTKNVQSVSVNRVNTQTWVVRARAEEGATFHRNGKPRLVIRVNTWPDDRTCGPRVGS